MSTWYSLRSSFTSRPDVMQMAVLEHVARDPGLSYLLKEGTWLSVTSGHNGVTVDLEFSDNDYPDDLDDAWIRLVKKYADFSSGPVEATNEGPFEAGPSRVWRIGPEIKVLRAEAVRLDSEIKAMELKQKKLQELLSKATDQVIVR